MAPRSATPPCHQCSRLPAPAKILHEILLNYRQLILIQLRNEKGKPDRLGEELLLNRD